ncbi:MAG: D-cysteine desulfhydrase family protein [Alphaproteobacteria bacterium]|nr:D-cysteine desulfhydrase family protein [Alphaproteobacteria bacterium]
MQDLASALARFPQAPLGQAMATPLERAQRLSDRLGLDLWLKRDDCTGLAMGGNKARQIEYYLGEALDQGADTVLITGAVQSNVLRTIAAAGARLGLRVCLQLEERVATDDPLYHTGGNVFLDRLFGAELRAYPHGEDEAGADRALAAWAEELRAAGRKPYVIPLGPGHRPLGALGYCQAAIEYRAQCRAHTVHVIASGSGASHGGLLFGLRALGCQDPVLGLCVRRDAGAQIPRLFDRCREIGELLGMENPVHEDDIAVFDDALAPGYGRLSPALVDAITLMARTEGVVLDPVYTGKVFAGLLALRRRHVLPDGERVCFWHTGGAPALFAYQGLWDAGPAA